MRAKEITSVGESKLRFVEMFRKFLPLCMKVLELDTLPKMIFQAHIHDASQPTFGRFDNEAQTLSVALANRHPNDILRTVAHELQHYKQGTEHRLRPDSGETGSPIENEAHAMAGIVMRHFNKLYPEYLSDRPVIAENLAWKKNLKELAPNPRDDDEGGDDKGDDGFELPVKFVGDGRAIIQSNKRKYVSPFPRGEVFTGKVYIMWDKPKIEIIWYLDPKDDETRKAIYTKNYKERYANPLSLWYDTTGVRYRYVTTWKLVPAKEPGGFPGIIDAIGQDQKKQVMDDAMGFIAEIIQKDGDGRHFVEKRQGVAENFADGRNPQDKGDSKRHGVPTKASVNTLRKVAKQGGRKGQLAHWMANMKAGREKAKRK